MSSSDSPTPGKGARVTGHIMSGFVVFGLVASAIMKLMQTQQVVDGFAQQGWPAGSAVTIGTIELIVGIIYAIPRLSVLGAILVTGYFGGAVCVSLRYEPAGLVVALICGILAWGGLYLRDPRIRALIPLKS
jgi:hypothetical protein